MSPLQLLTDYPQWRPWCALVSHAHAFISPTLLAATLSIFIHPTPPVSRASFWRYSFAHWIATSSNDPDSQLEET